MTNSFRPIRGPEHFRIAFRLSEMAARTGDLALENAHGPNLPTITRKWSSTPTIVPHYPREKSTKTQNLLRFLFVPRVPRDRCETLRNQSEMALERSPGNDFLTPENVPSFWEKKQTVDKHKFTFLFSSPTWKSVRSW